MSEYTLKTFDDGYGRHALVYQDSVTGVVNMANRPAFGRTDVQHLLDDRRAVHPTRLYAHYQPTHVKVTFLATLHGIVGTTNA